MSSTLPGKWKEKRIMIVIGCGPPRTLADRRSCFRCQDLYTRFLAKMQNDGKVLIYLRVN